MSYIFNITSFLICTLTLYYVKTDNMMKIYKIFLAILPSVLIFFMLLYYISDYFTGNGIDESVIHQVSVGISGANIEDYMHLIIITFAVFIFMIFITIVFYTRVLSNCQTQRPLFLLGLLPAFILNTGMSEASMRLQELYKNSLTIEDTHLFDELYVTPKPVPIIDMKFKNIVFLYVESMERSYFDNTLFPNLMENLEKIERQNISFTNLAQVQRTGWTIAGMVASQCGIPLVTNMNPTQGINLFLPKAVCLGDILSSLHYNMLYIGGASLDFAKKGAFYKNHGFDEQDVKGLSELMKTEKNLSVLSGWGIFDNDLYPILFDKYQEMSEKKEPFALFALTLDTHHPNGLLHPTCKEVYRNGSNQLLNIFKCTDKMLNEFVTKIAESKYANDTILIIASDHLSQNNSVYNILKKEPTRKNTFIIVDFENKIPKRIDRVGSTLDIGPTLLDYLGIPVKALGMGRSLLSEEPTLLERYKNVGQANLQLARWKDNFMTLWQSLDLDKGIDVSSTEVKIAGHLFETPMLIEFDKSLNIKELRALELRSLTRHHLTENMDFILIDKCKISNILVDKTEVNEQTCMLVVRYVGDNVIINHFPLLKGKYQLFSGDFFRKNEGETMKKYSFIKELKSFNSALPKENSHYRDLFTDGVDK